MAKRRAGRGGFNMAEAIREQLKANPDASLKECLAAVEAAHPEVKVNANSFGVAFSNQRRKLGLKPRRRGRVVRRRKPGMAAGPVRAVAVSSGGLNMELLQAARKFVAVAGDADTAVAAVRALALLQIN
jgi:hypothetical protein